MPRPKPAEPWITIPVRVTQAQREILENYRDFYELPSVADALRDLINQAAKTSAGRPVFYAEPIADLIHRTMGDMAKAAKPLVKGPFGAVDALTGKPIERSRASPKKGK